MATLANVTLTIHKAEGLVGLNPGGTSNPVVTATIGAQSASTAVVNKTTNPTFTDATFVFQSCPLPTVLTFKVLNRLPFVDVEDLLGTATLTLFDATSAKVDKVVTLSHGGNAALAQKAGEKGCGSLSMTYEVAETAASPVNAGTATTFPTTNTAAASSTPRPEATPIPLPAAANITGTQAAQPPVTVASTNRSSSSSSSSTPEHMKASNPSATNPAARSPKIAAAAAAPALLPSNLTPPSLTPARAPVGLGFLVADSAAAAPPASATPLPLKNVDQPGFVSYPVRGLRVPEVDATTTSVEAPVPVSAPTTSTELFFANNGSHDDAVIARPLGVTQPPMSNLPDSLLPVADKVPQASHYTPTSVHRSAAVARSASSSVPAVHTPSSSLYTSAAAAPVAQPQPLLVVPPHIEGTPKLDSQTGTSSRPVSAMQLLPQPVASGAAAALPTFPATVATVQNTHASSSSMSGGRPTSTSAAVVAVAPRPAPWSRNNSHPNTPAMHATHGSSSSSALRQPVTLRISRPRSGEDLVAAEGAARSCSKHRQEQQLVTAAAMTNAETEGDKVLAAQIYADPQYLFESAATGNDLGIFARLKAADPFFANGFLHCRDYAGRTLLHAAAWHGQVEVLRLLLSDDSASAASDKNWLLRGSLVRNLLSSQGGNSLLHAAAMGGQKAVVAYLAQSNQKAFQELKLLKNERGLTPAEAAKEAGFTDVAMLLV